MHTLKKEKVSLITPTEEENENVQEDFYKFNL